MSETDTESKREADKTARLAIKLCWVAVLLAAVSLMLPALRVQGGGRGEWIAGDPGFQCAFLSLAESPSWVPHALLIAAPFIATFAGKPAQKASGLLLGITTLTVLHVCIPQVALANPWQGPLPGFWLWAAALITAAAGLLLGGFSPVRTSEPWPSSAPVSQHGRTRPGGAIVLCWLAFAIFAVTNLVNLGHFIDGSFPRGLSRGISFFVLDQVVVPALLAMAPLACLYAGARAQRFMAMALGFLGLLPFLSIDRPAEQPFEALAPLLVSYLTVVLAVTGLLVAAGLMNRNRKAPAGPAESASARASRSPTRHPRGESSLRARQSASGCRFMLAGSGTLARPRIFRVPL